MSATVCLRLLSLLLAAFIFNPTLGHACTATAPDAFTVGNKATDPTCTYDTIQEAINAATCPAGTKIIITPERTYDAQHLTITGKNISLIGRGTAPHCSSLQAICGTLFPCPTNPLGTINGSSSSVLTVRGNSNVLVQYLTITGGNHRSGGAGGGIDFDGAGSLTLDTSHVSFNTADYGGGINFTGRNGDAALTIGANTWVSDNKAYAAGSPINGSGSGGGGIRIDGTSTLAINAPGSFIYHNDAVNGDGGGILMVGGGASIGAVAFNGGPLIYNNHAQYGGGIAIFANASQAVAADIFAVDSSHPVRIESNSADHLGGGILVQSYINGGTSAWGYANMGGVRVDGNVAIEGSAIYSADDTSVGIYKSGKVSFFAGHCAAGVECNTVSDNGALDPGGNPTNGSAILIQSNGSLEAHTLRMRGNSGAHAIRVLGANSLATLTDCLLVDNDFTAELLALEDGVTTTITQCTFAHNTIGAAQVMSSGTGGFTLNNSIIGQPGVNALKHSAGISVSNIVAYDTTGLPATADIVQANPEFIDAANGDFRLLVERIGSGLIISPAVDFAPRLGGNDLDIDLRPRDQDIPEAPDRNGGQRDLGAYEMQPINGRIFADRFGDALLLAN